MASTSSPITTLTTLQQTLHLLHHRNKNQHRLAKWYKSLSQFRRQIPKLVAEIEAYEAARAIKKESVYVTRARETLRARIEFLRERYVGRWYLAFLNVISDNQWSAIGLMLLGSLARFRGVLNEVGRDIGLEEENIEEDEVEQVSIPQEEAMKVDLGEVVERTAIQGMGKDEKVRTEQEKEEVEVEVDVRRKEKREKKRKEIPDEQKAETTEPKSTPAKKVKKKRKGGDAFDDLFDSLM